jgi:hypothetical protein
LGLKIFLALDPSVMIVFYDSWIYKIGDRRQTVIETNNELDIDNLNLIHFINCNNIIFFNQDASKEYITQLHERSKKFIKANIPIVKEYPYIDPYGNTSSKSTIMVSSQTDCKTNMSLSFMKLTSNAKEYIFDNKAVKLRKGHEHREKYRS